MPSASIELTYLAWVALLTALMWIPYVLNRFIVWGLQDTVGYPEHPKPLAPWAERAKKGHLNAVENLAIFATLVLAAAAMGVHTDLTALAAMIYLWARIAHWVVYVAKLPWFRTVAFLVGWACQVAIAYEILFARAA